MYDKELVKDILGQILLAVNRIQYRFTPVDSSDFFLDTEEGLEKLDSICLALVAIGESLKNLDKITDTQLLPRYPQIQWKRIKGLRDVISHHYFDLDAEIIFDICDNHIKPLKETLVSILTDLD